MCSFFCFISISVKAIKLHIPRMLSSWVFSHDSFGRRECIGGGGRAATHGRKSSRALLVQLSGALEIRCDRIPDWIEGIKALNQPSLDVHVVRKILTRCRERHIKPHISLTLRSLWTPCTRLYSTRTCREVIKY